MNAAPARSAPAETWTSSSRERPRNILFLLPLPPDHQPGEGDTSSFIEMARSLAREGYVYVARSGQRDWADDEFGVRYLPLDNERLPSFGALAKAFVFHDESLALAVAAEHPGADVFLVRNTSSH